MNPDSESSPTTESLPHALADIGDTIDLDDGALWQRVTQRRRANRRRRTAVGGLGTAVIVATVATTAIALTNRTGPSLRVGTSSLVSTSTTLAPLPLQDLAHAANCAAPEYSPTVAPWPPGLSMHFVPTTTTLAPGEAVQGRIDLDNSSNAPISVTRNGAVAFAASGNTLVGRDALAPGQPIPLAMAFVISVPAHGHASTVVGLTMAPCGVGLRAIPPLPPGKYEIYVTLPSENPGPAVLVAPPVSITVEPASRTHDTSTTNRARVVVPDLIGMDPTSMTDTLQPLGLTAASTNAKSTTVVKGHVFAQDPAAGTHVPTGTVVHVVISGGP
jgi:Uncharacterized protein conserved in bacteria